MKKILFAVSFALTFFAQGIFACTLSVPSIGKFDETEYVFIGEVIGYTESFDISETLIDSAISTTFQSQSDENKKANGLIVRVKESVFLPKIPKTHFEVFPYDLGADCSIAGIRDYTLKKKYPLNSEIRVIAKEAKYLPPNLPGGNIRLEDRPGERGSVSLNYDVNKTGMTSVASVFDYKSFQYDMNKDSESKYLLPNFEIRKDLLRLSKAANRKERTLILERLLFAPTFSDLDFYSLFKNFTLTEVEFKSYFETHLKRTSPEIFEQYKAYNDALDELIRLGYERAVGEKAISKALEEGTEISKQKLLEKSLEILRKAKSNK
jgi:hypothetical protein